jgi:TetR/AcrR family transcriptional regulator, transcriptional repressor for nem operon
MGHSQAEKAQTHERIIRIASERLREKGIDGVGVADLMKEAGLTVGGFYKHFGSRDDLVTEAIGSALGSWQAKIANKAADGEKLTLGQLVGSYLSTAHRDAPGKGCAVSALVCDIARSGDETRSIFTEQVRHDIALIAGLLDGENAGLNKADSNKAQAVLTFCALIGAVSLSRAVSDDEMSREILATVEQALTGTSG